MDKGDEGMDRTERKISRIARVAGRFSTRMMRRQGIGPAEFDFVQMVRHHPGITQTEICQKLELDKGAAARQSANLEAKGYLRREPNPDDGRSQLLFVTDKADELKSSKAHLEMAFYDWLTEPLSEGELTELDRMLEILLQRCREGREDHFAAVREKLEQAEE